jgi:hypothetical protein
MNGSTMLKSVCLGIAVLLGVAIEANGVFMLLSPADWYMAVPGVTSTGPFNQHFVRDIGLIFLLLGGGFLAGAALPRSRILLWAFIPRDFPAVTLPAIIGILLTLWAIRQSRGLAAKAA